MTGYTRQQTYIDGEQILASHTNDEFDLLQEVFDTTLGHKHNGSVGQGAYINLLSDNDNDTKIEVEQAADEDIMHFTVGGVEIATADGSGLSFKTWHHIDKTEDLINGAVPAASNVVLSSGYSATADGGSGVWRRTGVTGLTASQSPANLVDGKLTDASGAEWEIVGSRVNIKSLGAKGDDSTDDTLVLQAAAAYALRINGATVYFPEGIYIISSTIEINQRTFFEGEGGWFKNQFTDNEYTVGGSTIKLAAASNTDMIRFRYSVGAGEVINDYRLHSGLRNLQIFGYRSESQSPTVKDLNSSGNGIVISGARYVTLENVLSTKCADDGVRVESHDYGAGAISSNNVDIRACALLSNGGRGILAAGGDSIMTNCQVGYNGSTGASVTGWGLFSNNLVWNNKADGVYLVGSSQSAIIVGNKIYDNEETGLNLGDATSMGVIVGNKILRNAVAGTAGVSNLCGIFINSQATSGIVITGNEVGNDTGVTQEYGIYFNSSLTRVEGWAGNTFYGNNTANITLADTNNIRLHESIGSSTPLHPGFTLEGDIDLNSNSLVGWSLRDYTDDSGQTAVLTTPTNLTNVGVNGAIYHVSIAHIGGNAGARAIVLGDDTTPVIITQDSGGSDTYTFTISGTTLRANTGSGALTSNWSVFRTV